MRSHRHTARLTLLLYCPAGSRSSGVANYFSNVPYPRFMLMQSEKKGNPFVLDTLVEEQRAGERLPRTQSVPLTQEAPGV